MTRIVGGEFGGRTLQVPPRGTRPTSDRVREAVFSRLEHHGVLRGARVLDLYSGSGALGLEAVSRGASHATLVDAARSAVEMGRRNARSLGAHGVAVVHDKAERFVASPPVQPWGLVFLDPPYDVRDTTVDALLGQLASTRAVTSDTLVVVERARRSPAPAWPEGWEPDTSKVYGETTVHYAFAGPASSDERSDVDGEADGSDAAGVLA
ncbi:16S rRNA (guanine966-N2)-methyltransferase [Sediminihabitans luteus]|uniref:16S rRNA (Guanine966-N2)-methyltransferase n=1 Tax=Sediminihabitans luteus TaxID=1138585 RepID=A0A2M9CPK2_9CELL|nr:16S rRNA (guanine(966)-N(2))-methyltransferase RsmD [Sediminihabitans luteus]PJJ73813.1 16S rRNA (guanine966-N2)-methyltransferase [Sediminihabitans luteus]GIJ00490.1 methyltransferase [Sediminihabitans luteus]